VTGPVQPADVAGEGHGTSKAHLEQIFGTEPLLAGQD
jgi:hypothetical protein